LFIYLLLPSICAHTEENVETVNDLVLSQKDKPHTYRTVREISQETGIHRSSVSQIICKDLHVKYFKGAIHRSWQKRTALLAWSALSFCFRRSRSMPLTLFSSRTKRCSRSFHLTVGRTKAVADWRYFWRRSLAFSSMRALRFLPLPGLLLTVPVSHNFLNSSLKPYFVQLFSGNSFINLLAVYPFKCKPFFNQNLDLVA